MKIVAKEVRACIFYELTR